MRGLTAKLRALGAAVNERFPKVNYGGCCVYAAAVAKALEKHGIHVECVVPDYSDVRTVEEARNNLRLDGNEGNTAREWAAAGISFAHVAVRFRNGVRWFTHDSDVTLVGRAMFGWADWSKQPKYDALPDGMTPDEAWAIADRPDGWNSTFNRAHIPELRRMVLEALA